MLQILIQLHLELELKKLLILSIRKQILHISYLKGIIQIFKLFLLF